MRVVYNVSVIGDWPSGKAQGSGPWIGVKIASGNLQGRSRNGDEAGPTDFSTEKYRWVESDSNPFRL
jgi:hypothetical protein